MRHTPNGNHFTAASLVFFWRCPTWGALRSYAPNTDANCLMRKQPMFNQAFTPENKESTICGGNCHVMLDNDTGTYLARTWKYLVAIILRSDIVTSHSICKVCLARVSLLSYFAKSQCLKKFVWACHN
eukprot:TRINITY_DN5467_c0_g1_i1.p1 TRINITY_DN5467_c0_g1~~TRINITY_DN5467_c0_g1_i1.p1  ORF type:complete len:128 (-),score=6.51 TRINITY_DN5467_c0_g1_i1:1804-2187(-)